LRLLQRKSKRFFAFLLIISLQTNLFNLYILSFNKNSRGNNSVGLINYNTVFRQKTFSKFLKRNLILLFGRVFQLMPAFKHCAVTFVFLKTSVLLKTTRRRLKPQESLFFSFKQEASGIKLKILDFCCFVSS